MSPFDVAGLVGVALILVAYAAVQLKRLDATRAPALWMNLAGSSLILLSLTRVFNLSAAIVEAAWALIAIFGLVRTLFERR
jgi:tellurite resistance protein TehA-like permease